MWFFDNVLTHFHGVLFIKHKTIIDSALKFSLLIRFFFIPKQSKNVWQYFNVPTATSDQASEVAE